MELNQLSDGERHSESCCAAAGCDRKATVVLYAPDHLPLCDEHWEARVDVELDLANRSSIPRDSISP